MALDANRFQGMQAGDLPRAGALTLQLTHLRWLATIVPAVGVFAYETLRHQIFATHPHGANELYGNLLTGGITLVFSYLFASMIFRSVERIQQQAVEETRIATALSSMVEERERLSRELHDGLAQVLSYLLVRLDTVRNLVEQDRQAYAISELESLRATVDNVNVDVRESIAGLRSRVVERGLVEALRDYLEEYEERYGIHTELRLSGQSPELTPNADLQLFRIVQEALTNVRKHSAASEVRVGIARTRENLEVVVADNGGGFEVDDAVDNRAFGLVSMRERALSLEGECSVVSNPGRGTTITVTVPPGPVAW